LTDPTVYTQKVNRLKNLTDQFGTDGASGRAADFILNSITEPTADDVSQAA